MTDISVVIPTRNAGRWIDACLTGVEQSAPAEVIVVDGGSTDGTRGIARGRADAILDDDGAGVAAARQIGVEAARSPWVALIDADVVLGPGNLESLVAEAEARQLDGLQAALFSIGEGDYWSEQLARHHNRGQVRDWFGVSATVVRRETLLAHPFDRSLRSGEDIDLRLRLRAAGVAVAVSTTTWVVHRFGRGYRFCRGQWLADGEGLGRMVRSHGLRAVPNALAPLPAAALGAVESIPARLKPLPYFAGFAVGNWIGLLRGLSDARVPVDGRGRRLLCSAVIALTASLGVIAPVMAISTATGISLILEQSYAGAGWAAVVPALGLVALCALELAGPEKQIRALLRLARPAAWGLGSIGLLAAAARLAGVIA